MWKWIARIIGAVLTSVITYWQGSVLHIGLREQIMNVFVVIDDAMGGDQYAGVHRTQPDPRPGARVVEIEVAGTQPDPHLVYVAQIYDRTMDVHRFAGVYGDYEAAHRASGPKGVTLTVRI